jgi:hypothetical protein
MLVRTHINIVSGRTHAVYCSTVYECINKPVYDRWSACDAPPFQFHSNSWASSLALYTLDVPLCNKLFMIGYDSSSSSDGGSSRCKC